MRTMMTITIPVKAGNQAIKDGALPKTMADALERLRPEAAYFFTENGARTALMVIDVKDPSEIPAIVEPFFMEFNAAVQLTPVMNADDLKKGLARIA